MATLSQLFFTPLRPVHTAPPLRSTQNSKERPNRSLLAARYSNRPDFLNVNTRVSSVALRRFAEGNSKRACLFGRAWGSGEEGIKLVSSSSLFFSFPLSPSFLTCAISPLSLGVFFIGKIK